MITLKEIEENYDVEKIRPLFGTEAVPIQITSINAWEYFAKYIYPFLEYNNIFTFYIPSWYFMKLLCSNSNIFYDKILHCQPLNIKNIEIKVYNCDYENNSYLYITDTKDDYYGIVKYCAEP